MNIIKDIYSELEKLGLNKREYLNFDEIRNKDGAYLFRVKYTDQFYVLKYFLNEEYTREIENYSILKELGIPTIKCFGKTEKSLLLEDITKSKRYRLGMEADLSDIEVAKALVKWYIKLHREGQRYVLEKSTKFYRESDIINEENIEFIKNKSNTVTNKVWDLISKNLDLIFAKIASEDETLTYNDFYWTNFIVSNDKKDALMFDYNLLGAGFKYNDVRNVCSSLSDDARETFNEEYGKIDVREKIIDDGISILINLIHAFRRPLFPSWAQESLNSISNGLLEKSIIKILELP